jgi:predicted secreted protein
MVLHKKRSIAIVLMLLVSLSTIFAGDVAHFINLGFSPDSRVFMFAQHGIGERDGTPFAEIFTVDVPANDFVPGGLRSAVYDVSISPGQDGLGALLTLLPEAAPIVRDHRVSHLRQGRLVYLLVNGETERENIEFRDFENGDRYTVTMTQNARGAGETGSAAFHIDVTTRFASGVEGTHRVGRPGFYRDGVNRYRVRQILLSPDESSLVIVVERITNTSSGQRIRYMVETVRVR